MKEITKKPETEISTSPDRAAEAYFTVRTRLMLRISKRRMAEDYQHHLSKYT